MKKYMDKVTELFSENVGIFFVIVLFMTLLEYIPTIISNRVLGTSLFDLSNASNSFSQSFNGGSYGSMAGGLLLIALFVAALMYAVSSFTMGGFLSFLDSGKDEQNKFGYFVSQGFNKWGRMFGGYLLQLVIVILAAIAFGIVLGIIVAIFYSSSGGLDSSIGFATVLTAIFTLIFSALTMYIPYEVALSNHPVTKCVSIAMSKAKKVFWPTFGLLVLLSLLGYGLVYAFGSFDSSYIISLVIAYLVAVLGNFTVAFFFYPLYKSVSETDEEASDRILEIHTQPSKSTLPTDDPFDTDEPRNTGFSE